MTIRQGARQLATGQRSRLHVLHVDSGEDVVIAESGSLLFEAPNWTPDGAWLLVNGDGGLFRVAPSGGGLVPVGLGDVPGINNDHVLSPDGSSVFVSAFDGHLYEVRLATGESRRVSNERGDDSETKPKARIAACSRTELARLDLMRPQEPALGRPTRPIFL